MLRNSQHNDSSAAPPEDAYVLPFREFFRVLWRRVWVILLVVGIFAGTAVGFSFAQQPVYEASIKLWVGQKQGLTEETPTDIGSLQDLTATMAQAIAVRPVAEQVIQQEGLQVSSDTFLNERLIVSQVEDTQLIEVSYRDSDPQRAQRVANAIGEVFSGRITSVSQGTGAITAPVYEDAAVPDEPVSPNPLRDGLLAAVLGAVIGAGLVLLLEYFDDRWRSPEELEQVSGVPVFGVIPHFEAPRIKKGKG